MPYIPNAEDAFAVYILAVTYFDDIPPLAFASAQHMNVKELEIKGEFYIWDKEELDSYSFYRSPLAVCSYDKTAETWTVELINGRLAAFRDLGNLWELVRVKKKSTQGLQTFTQNDAVAET